MRLFWQRTVSLGVRITAGLTLIAALLLSGRDAPRSNAQAAPTFFVTAQASPNAVKVNDTVTFTASVDGRSVPEDLQFTWDFGDSTTKTSGASVTHAYTKPGTFTATVTVTSAGTPSNTAMATASVSVSAAAGTGTGATPALTVTVSASPATAGAGQQVTVNFATAATAGGSSPPIQSLQIDYGDGVSPDPLTPPSGSIQHSYGKPGTYTITVRALGSGMVELGKGTTQITITAAAASPTPVTASGPTVTYQPGWNLVGAPAGTTYTQASGPLYTFPAGAAAYVSNPNTQGVVAGQGYWAFFNQSTTVSLSGTNSDTGSVSAPAGQYVMIGNPSATQTLSVSGADAIFTFDTGANNYTAVTSLAPGQGAWVLSNAGGTITLGP